MSQHWMPIVGQNEGSGIGGIFVLLLYLGIIVLVVAGFWKTFEKAGQPGWAAIVPFYNMYVITQIVGRPILWFVLTLIPCVNIVVFILLGIDMAKSFGKDAGFGVGLGLLPAIFYPILGFGSAQYQGPAAAQANGQGFPMQPPPQA